MHCFIWITNQNFETHYIATFTCTKLFVLVFSLYFANRTLFFLGRQSTWQFPDVFAGSWAAMMYPGVKCTY
ncbi:unnamed protein product [Amaranthus hypochondriacus]